MLAAVLVAGIATVILGGARNASADVVERRALPAPDEKDGAPLARVLAMRRSVRAFRSDVLADASLSQLLWAAQGVTGDGHRTAPSAGALYPLAIFVVDAQGVWRYVPGDHVLVRERGGDLRAAVARACFGQSAASEAPVLIVIAADVSITARKYGNRAARYAALEAGHAAQNLLLTATSLGLGAVPMGAFDDAALAKAVGISTSLTPFYVVPVGTPREPASP